MFRLSERHKMFQQRRIEIFHAVVLLCLAILCFATFSLSAYDLYHPEDAQTSVLVSIFLQVCAAILAFAVFFRECCCVPEEQTHNPLKCTQSYQAPMLPLKPS